jgi:hypothetical protein
MTIYLKLSLTSFNHVINVMDVYTQSNQKYFSLSGIIKLVYNCFPWKLNVRVALSAQFSKYNKDSDTSFLFTNSNVSHRWMGVTWSDIIPTLVSIFWHKSQLLLGSPHLPGFADLPSRTTGRQQNHSDPHVTETKEYWRITLYYQFVDHLLKDLRDHLVKKEDRFLA